MLAAVLGVRLWSMAAVPLIDESEPRYAEMARVMATSGDWITPWFAPGVPFWGKPPLSFWTEALAFRLFGVGEFTSRLPSWLAMLATLALIYACARALFGARQARWATLVYSTAVLPAVAAGAVLTDPFLVLGTTLCMTAFVLAPKSGAAIWRYGFFVGIAIGLLSKGPLAPVLVGGAVVPWMLLHRNAREYLKALPWVRGCILAAVLAVPWYIAAELKTPGFLQYFIVGEHFLRFIDKGWTGDLYGSAHKRPYGSIWLDLLLAALPWSLVWLWSLSRNLVNAQRRQQIRTVFSDSRITYLLAWSIFTPLFFTVAGNILWTYVLPALPALAILTGVYISGLELPARRSGAVFWIAAALIPVAMAVGCVYISVRPESVKSEKNLVAHAESAMGTADRLFYLDDTPYSASFYSNGTAGAVQLNKLATVAPQADSALLLAVPKHMRKEFNEALAHPLQPAYENERYLLFRVAPGDIGG
jgi:4-amino-4-deoxy-L-arabinose transferase-like glycosyltransferase